jgi:hypothetical protein
MTTQQQGLLDGLTEAGWELAATEQLHEWWADDVWRMRSVWSPQGCECYITFLVDPQLDLHRKRKSSEGVWAVSVTPTLPVGREQLGPEFPLRHGWQERVREIVSYVSRFRRE